MSLAHQKQSAPSSRVAVGAFLLIVLASFATAVPALGQASSPAEHAPQVCSGFNRNLTSWGMIGSTPNSPTTVCAPHHAYYGVATIQKSSISREAGKVMVVGNCCKLPAEDMLEDEHLEMQTNCPTGYVVTGARLSERPAICDSPDNSKQCTYQASAANTILRCTKINLQRYQLSEPTPSLTVGLTGPLRDSFEQRIARSAIPVAIRYGIGRSSSKRFAGKTCVGRSWGAVLTDVGGKACSQVQFRQFQFKGVPGDPIQGTPVRMFPDCDSLEHPVDPNPICRRYLNQQN